MLIATLSSRRSTPGEDVRKIRTVGSSGQEIVIAKHGSMLTQATHRPKRSSIGCATAGGPSWGHRRNNLLHDEDELFYGYYLSAAVMTADEQGPPSPNSPAG